MLDSKAKILKAALKLFITEGFDGTSTAKIVKESGVSNGTLFHYFKTKEDLINKLYITIKDDYRRYLLEHMKSCDTSKGKIKHLWYCCAQWHVDNEDSMTFFDMFSNSPYIDKLSKEEASRNFNFINELFLDAIKDEILINVSPNLLTYSFYSSIQAFYKYIKDYSENPGEYQDIAFRMWWRSVANI